ncbi:MAG TPA: DUF3375 family protein [Aquabacterium sp.]|nr:DUF3375 family protein [Aquabacterium sp.]
MDHATLSTLRDRHAWRLLASPHASLVSSFLHKVFMTPNGIPA